MNQVGNVLGAATNIVADSPVRIGERWLPWARADWALTALISLVTFGGTLILTSRFAEAPPARIVAGLAALGWTPATYFAISVASFAPLFVVYFVTGVFIFWQRPRDRMALFTSLFLMSFGATLAAVPAREYLSLVEAAPRTIFIPSFISQMLSFGLFAVFFATFPDGRFVPGWMRPVAMGGFLLSLAYALFPATVGTSSGPLGIGITTASFLLFASCLVAQVWRYRHHATALQKQQTKWFVFGFLLIVALATVPYLSLNLLRSGDARASVLIDLAVGLSVLTFGLLPISIAIAILRYRLYEIDVIIRKTLVYAILTVVLALLYSGVVVLLQGLFESLTGEVSPLAVVLSTLLIAALFNPFRRRIQALIDRRFFRQKYDAQQVLVHFAARARDEIELDELSSELVRVVEETVQPAQVTLWLRPAEEIEQPDQHFKRW